MTEAKAKNLIVLSATLTLGLGFLNSYIVKRKNPRVALLIGVGVLFILLSGFATLAPTEAGYFALLILLTAILAEGGGVLNFLMGRGTHDHLGTKTTGTPSLGNQFKKVISPANLISQGATGAAVGAGILAGEQLVGDAGGKPTKAQVARARVQAAKSKSHHSSGGTGLFNVPGIGPIPLPHVSLPSLPF